MSERASGWYDDPDDPTQLRYWDGILWSDRRMPKVKPGLGESRIGTPSAYRDESTGPADQRPASSPAPSGSAPPAPDSPPGQSQPNPYAYQGGAPSNVGYAPVPVGPTTADGQRLSGWWRRFAAWVVDHILRSLLTAIFAFPWLSEWVDDVQRYFASSIRAAERGEPTPDVPQSVVEIPAAFLIAGVLVYAIYEIGFTAWRGRTPGKMITGISIRMAAEARKPTVDEALRRFGIKALRTIVAPIQVLLGFAIIFMIVDSLWPLRDKQNQSLHDKVAKTVVVIGPPTGAVSPTDTYPPQPHSFS
ncbi:RDD family protein [Demetria terragena]|uniref:RDD family protein n=1 Tax=Demetria terragena TaxID=63959 RepID=UPI0003774821|nr:RDD family protein [Demetria terragena]